MRSKESIPGTPRPTIYKWLFPLDDFQPLHRKWLVVSPFPSILNWLFGVLGGDLTEGMEGLHISTAGFPLESFFSSTQQSGSFIARSPTSGSPEARDFYGFQGTS